MKKAVIILALAAAFALSACSAGGGGDSAPMTSSAPAADATGGAAETMPTDDAPELGAEVTAYTLENAAYDGIHFAADDVTLTLVGSNTLSGKLKAAGSLTITGDGSLTIDSGADDCINAAGDITIDGGVFTLSTEDDAVHSDAALTINGGTVNIPKSLEGLEAMVVTINGGYIHIAASDDAINASDGSDDDTVQTTPQGGRGGFGGDMVNNPALSVNITGGEVRLYAGTDGIDSNGGINITGGTVLSFSSASRTGGEGPLDANGETILAPTLFVSGQALKSGGVLAVTDAAGAVVFTETLTGDAGSMSLTLPGLSEGETYTVSVDGEQIAEAQPSISARGMMPGGGGFGGGGFGGGNRVPPDGEGRAAPEGERPGGERMPSDGERPGGGAPGRGVETPPSASAAQ